MSLDKLRAELEKALEKLGNSPEEEDKNTDAPESDGDEEGNSHKTARRHSNRSSRADHKLPRRTLGLHRVPRCLAGAGSRTPVDGLEPRSHNSEAESGDFDFASTTLSPPLSPRGTPRSEASDLYSLGAWLLTPTPSRDTGTPCSISDGQCGGGKEPLGLRGNESCSTLARCSTWSSIAGSDDSRILPSEASKNVPGDLGAQGSHFGWALGASLAPYHSSDLAPELTDLAAATTAGQPWAGEEALEGGAGRRRTVFADLVGCLYRIDEDDKDLEPIQHQTLPPIRP
mmetsp:Transcript_83129/g.258164  ORF Transcript_83129/g.258164 Transcript_83129/m.258164 type:complete len:286 (-) Transcript_83129:75-932(-)